MYIKIHDIDEQILIIVINKGCSFIPTHQGTMLCGLNTFHNKSLLLAFTSHS